MKKSFIIVYFKCQFNKWWEFHLRFT